MPKENIFAELLMEDFTGATFSSAAIEFTSVKFSPAARWFLLTAQLGEDKLFFALKTKNETWFGHAPSG